MDDRRAARRAPPFCKMTLFGLGLSRSAGGRLGSGLLHVPWAGRPAAAQFARHARLWQHSTAYSFTGTHHAATLQRSSACQFIRRTLSVSGSDGAAALEFAPDAPSRVHHSDHTIVKVSSLFYTLAGQLTLPRTHLYM